jgi:hypothetical protein
MGSFGVHGPELLRLRRVVLEGEEMVQAVKVTGDANVPAGAVSFRAKVRIAAAWCDNGGGERGRCLDGTARNSWMALTFGAWIAQPMGFSKCGAPSFILFVVDGNGGVKLGPN